MFEPEGYLVQKRDHYHVGNLPATLLTEARALLEESGPTKLSLRAVAMRAGVSSAAMYHHFESKADLLAQLAASGFRELEAAMRETPCGDTPRLSMVALSQAYFGFAVRNPGLYQLMFGPDWVPALMGEALLTARNAAYGALERALAKELGKRVDSAGVRRAALGGWALAHGLSMLHINKILDLPKGASEERLVAKALDGLNLIFEHVT